MNTLTHIKTEQNSRPTFKPNILEVCWMYGLFLTLSSNALKISREPRKTLRRMADFEMFLDSFSRFFYYLSLVMPKLYWYKTERKKKKNSKSLIQTITTWGEVRKKEWRTVKEFWSLTGRSRRREVWWSVTLLSSSVPQSCYKTPPTSGAPSLVGALGQKIPLTPR